MKCPLCKITLKRVVLENKLVDKCPETECNFTSHVMNMKIDELYLVVLQDEYGNEGLFGMLDKNNHMIPGIAADLKRLEELKVSVNSAPPDVQARVKVLKFSQREVLAL